VLALATVIYLVIIDKLVEEEGIVLTDDEALQSLSQTQAFLDRIEGFVYVVVSLKIICSCIGIYGAFYYKTTAVLISFGCYAVSFFIDMVGLNIGGMLLEGLFGYPHYYLFKEIKAGIMSKENYINEKHSCCCV